MLCCIFAVGCSAFRVPCSVFRVPRSVFRVPRSTFRVISINYWFKKDEGYSGNGITFVILIDWSTYLINDF